MRLTKMIDMAFIQAGRHKGTRQLAGVHNRPILGPTELTRMEDLCPAAQHGDPSYRPHGFGDLKLSEPKTRYPIIAVRDREKR
jgi:hypothetical protein